MSGLHKREARFIEVMECLPVTRLPDGQETVSRWGDSLTAEKIITQQRSINVDVMTIVLYSCLPPSVPSENDPGGAHVISSQIDQV
jgi:hypothetical protein